MSISRRDFTPRRKHWRENQTDFNVTKLIFQFSPDCFPSPWDGGGVHPKTLKTSPDSHLKDSEKKKSAMFGILVYLSSRSFDFVFSVWGNDDSQNIPVMLWASYANFAAQLFDCYRVKGAITWAAPASGKSVKWVSFRGRSNRYVSKR